MKRGQQHFPHFANQNKDPLFLSGKELLGTAVQPFVPMEVIGAMDSDGLGCIAWWAPEADDDMEE